MSRPAKTDEQREADRDVKAAMDGLNIDRAAWHKTQRELHRVIMGSYPMSIYMLAHNAELAARERFRNATRRLYKARERQDEAYEDVR